MTLLGNFLGLLKFVEEYLLRNNEAKSNLKIRAVIQHLYFGDPDPAVFLNADPDPYSGGKMNMDPCGSGSSLTNFVKNKIMKSFL